MSFFQALQAALNKQTTNHRKPPEQIDAAIRQLVSKAITTEGQVIDVFTATGLAKPDISILSDQFLAEVRGLRHKNVAAELLERLLKDELKVRSKRNLVQSHVFRKASGRFQGSILVRTPFGTSGFSTCSGDSTNSSAASAAAVKARLGSSDVRALRITDGSYKNHKEL